MKSEENEEKSILAKENYKNIKKLILQEQKNGNGNNGPSKNYMRLMKEIEKEQKGNENAKKNSKAEYTNLTEKIYSNNSTKLGNYYNKNHNDLQLYGSKKYDLYTVRTLVKEMAKYKKKVLNKIKENKKNTNICKNYAFESCDEKVILTPLAEIEKEKNEMEEFEKKKFDEIERCGVVNRRIEYTQLLNHRDSFRESLEEEKKLLFLMKNSVDKIEKNWLRYRKNKNFLKNNKQKEKDDYLEKEKEDNLEEKKEDNLEEKKGDNLEEKKKDNIEDKNEDNKEEKKEYNFEGEENNSDNNVIDDKLYDLIIDNFNFEILKEIKNIKKIDKTKNRCFLTKIHKTFEENNNNNKNQYIEELEKKFNELNSNYIEAKNKIEKLDLDNKQLQLLLTNTKSDYNTLKNKEKENEVKKSKEEEELVQNYKNIIDKYNKKTEENSILNKNYNVLLTEKNDLLQKYKNINDKYNKKIEENSNLSKNYNDLLGEKKDLLQKYNDIIDKNNKIIEETSNLDKNYNDLLAEKNDLKNTYDNLLQNYNVLNVKYKNELEDKNNKNDELNTIKNDYENLLKNNNQNLKKIKELSKSLNDTNNEKTNYLNKNKLLLDRISNLDEKIESLEKNKNIQNKENKNVLKQLNDKYNREKTDLNNDIEYLKNIINNKENEIEEKKNILKSYKNKDNELEALKNKLDELYKANQEKDNEIKNILLNLEKKSNENISLKNEISILRAKLINNDKVIKMKVDEYEKRKEDIKDNNINRISNENNNKNLDLNELIEENKNKEDQIKNLYQIIEQLKSKNNELNLVLSKNNVNHFYNDENYNLKNRLYCLLIQKYIDKNIIFDKRKFVYLLLERKFKQNIRNLRGIKVQNDNSKYKTANDSSPLFFKSKSKEKKFEMLRDSYKTEFHY